MRDVLLARIQPLVERLAEDLATLMIERVLAELDRVEQAFAVALSSYASDDPPSLMKAALGAELSAMLAPPPVPKRAEPALVERLAKREVENVRVAASASPPPSGRAERVIRHCRKCGRPGARADGCGSSHEPMTQAETEPDIADDEVDAALTVAGSRDDRKLPKDVRRELVKAEARKLRGELPEPEATFIV